MISLARPVCGDLEQRVRECAAGHMQQQDDATKGSTIYIYMRGSCQNTHGQEHTMGRPSPGEFPAKERS